MMKPKQKRFQKNNLPHVNKQTDNSAILMHCSNHLPTHPQALPLPTSRTKQDLNVDAIYKWEYRQCHHPSTYNLNPMDINFSNWVKPTGMTLICPDKVPKSMKVEKPIHVLHLPPVCIATSQYFHLQPCYENHQMMINISLNTTNLNTMKISPLEFWVWQHLEDHWCKTQLHKVADVPTLPVAHLYKHMIDHNGPILPFNLAYESIDDTASIWTLFLHTRIYIMAIGLLIPEVLRIFCCYIFWCWHAIVAYQPFWSDSSWHAIVNDDVEAAPIHRSNGKAW